MRRIIVLIMLCISCFGLFACVEKNYTLPWDQFCTDETGEIKLKTEDKKYIIHVLNESEWQNDLTDCGCDYTFYTQKQVVEYHSECGTFNDVTSKKSTKVAEEQRVRINSFLEIVNLEK